MREFLDFAFSKIPDTTNGEEQKVPCTCKRCNNSHYKTTEEINEDLFINGIVTGYTCWIYHGECEPPLKRARKDSSDDNDADKLFEMIHEVCGNHN